MSSKEETLTGFAGFREISTISFGEHPFVAAVVVSALLHAFVFLTLMAQTDFRAPEAFLQVSLPVIDVSLVSDPQGSAKTHSPLACGNKGKSSGSSAAAKENAVPVKKSVPEEEKKMTKTPSSSQSSLAEGKIAVKPLEASASEGKITSPTNTDPPAVGGIDFNVGKGGSTGKPGSGLQDNAGGNPSYGHASGTESGAGEGGISSGGKGGYAKDGRGLSFQNSAAIPRYRDNTPPVYPSLARRRGYQGLVVLIVEVMADGRAGEVRIGRSSGYQMLDNAAREAATKWSFEPGTKNGKATRMFAEVPVRFVLDQ